MKSKIMLSNTAASGVDIASADTGNRIDGNAVSFRTETSELILYYGKKM
jgi:hypothetical protein